MSNQEISQESRSKATVICVVIALIVAALFLPAISLPLFGLDALGFALLRSAVVHRNEGWITGVTLGTVFAVLGIGGVAAIVVRSR